ncbi:BTB/POZ and MATH domain-containing protein 4-like [Panicum miliaceum]|uniref:BTB/POZ and MATH domain-containing protein 4-like n=1 Tax=Panicum miliaceum TaxID=4540 RepID=A0A3L6QA90_PANMI|nr:BTB/POZ and MATH domain-containing protein 4-like [Panicum miliaceum]
MFCYKLGHELPKTITPTPQITFSANPSTDHLPLGARAPIHQSPACTPTMATAGGAAAATTSASEVSVSSHLFTVRGYANTKGIGVGVSIESPAFDAAGHRWSVVFYPDGEDQDASGHISVFVRLLSEASDHVTVLYGFSLVDPTGAAPAAEASKAPKVATFGGGDARGIGCFMEQETFEASPYLQDDCFTIKCVIGAVERPGSALAPPASELPHGFDRLRVDGAADDAWSDVGGSSGEASD